MGYKRLHTLEDCSRYRLRLRIECLQCRRIVIEGPMRIMEVCRQRRWGIKLDDVEKKLRCTACKAKKVKLGPEFD